MMMYLGLTDDPNDGPDFDPLDCRCCGLSYRATHGPVIRIRIPHGHGVWRRKMEFDLLSIRARSAVSHFSVTAKELDDAERRAQFAGFRGVFRISLVFSILAALAIITGHAPHGSGDVTSWLRFLVALPVPVLILGRLRRRAVQDRHSADLAKDAADDEISHVKARIDATVRRWIGFDAMTRIRNEAGRDRRIVPVTPTVIDTETFGRPVDWIDSPPGHLVVASPHPTNGPPRRFVAPRSVGELVMAA
jgi:hypothetical protein